MGPTELLPLLVSFIKKKKRKKKRKKVSAWLHREYSWCFLQCSSLAGQTFANVCPAKLSCIGYHCGCMLKGVNIGPPYAMANMPQSTFPGSCCTADTLTGINVSPSSSRWIPCKFVLTTLGVMEVACLLNTPGFHLQLSRRSPNETPRCGEFDCSHVSLGKLKGGLNITLGGPKTIFWGPILIGAPKFDVTGTKWTRN